jgi:SAM-dependent methyltransferase
MQRFCQAMGVTADTRILDVGGSPETWAMLPVRPKVTLLNIPMSITDRSSDMEWVAGDGCQLPFADKTFDIVFSNSVIEHVGDAERQRAFARETARVGKRYFVQTPDRGFPVEQHLFMPLLHWLPRSWQQAIVPRFTVWEHLARPTPDQRAFYLCHYLEDIQLLGAGEMRALFPDAQITRERVLGLPKSLIALRR